MTDEEKDEIVAKLIATSEGRAALIKIANDTGTMDKFFEAILKSLENFAKA